MKKGNLAFVLLSTAALRLLTGCGGGDATDVAGVGPRNKWTENAGLYVGCSGHEKTTVEFVTVGADQAMLTYRQDFFDQLNCSGTVKGTFSAPLPYRIRFLSSESANVIGFDGRSTSLVIDKIEIAAPAMNASLTGAGVTGLCVLWTGGGTCYESLALAAQTIPGGLYLDGATMATLTFNGATYILDEPILTRQR